MRDFVGDSLAGRTLGMLRLVFGDLCKIRF